MPITQAPHTVVIAEIGVNHNGDVGLAKKLISAARDVGADYAKFQTFSADDLVTADAGVAAYQQPAALGGTQQDMLRGLELTHADFRELKTFSESLGLGFLTTAHDFTSLDFVLRLDLDYIKIPSGDLTNRPLLERVAGEGTKIILSTGMGSFDEVAQAVEVHRDVDHLLGREARDRRSARDHRQQIVPAAAHATYASQGRAAQRSRCGQPQQG
jgi:sialic acid synthase SpsE